MCRYCLSVFGPNGKELESRLFDKVHVKTSQEIKIHVENAIQQDESKLRIPIATKVIGLGLDIKLDLIVHFGVPSIVEDYLQQVGKAG